METAAHPPEHVPDRHLDEPIRVVDLRSEVEALWPQIQGVNAGHSARTLLKEGKLRMVLLALRNGSEVGEHKVDGECSLHVLSGRIVVLFDGEQHELGPGQVIGIGDRIRHDVRAVDDSSVLLTVSMLR